MVANDFLTTLDAVQLRTGLVKPLLEHTKPDVGYVGSSFILDVRRRLDEMEGSLWVEDKWTPSIQRESDASLMKRFSGIEWINQTMLRKANEVRLYLRVVTIADLADETGRFIPDGMLCGDWQAGSDLHWPE